MPDEDLSTDKPTKKAKKAKPLTSGQLREAAAKKVKAEPVEKKTPTRVPDTRLYTVVQWARGRYDPITRAFVSTHVNTRIVKRTPAEWIGLYKKFLTQPRG